MQRLLLIIAGLCLCVLAGCAGSRPAANDDLSVMQTTSGYGSAHFRNYWDEGESVYVRISGEAPAAVLLDEPDPFASPMVALYFGQRLEVLDESKSNYILVSTTGVDELAQGWVWRPLVASRPPVDPSGDEARIELDGAERASTVLNRGGLRFTTAGNDGEPSEELKRGLRDVDDFESGLARAMGSSWRVERYREFGKAGGLLSD